MVKDMIFGTVGGLGLFLFGMGIMSEGLKKAASRRVRKLLTALTRHRMIAVMIGAATTCLIQSSSATTVMTVGFVNAGLMTLKQALCVVLGANVGTTFTAWLVSGLAVFKITTYSLPAIGIGFLVRMLGRTQRTRNIGEVILGFGILFTGIDFMKGAFGPLQESQNVQEALIWLGHKPYLAVLAGTLVTMMLQSSSATIAMVQILALNGAFGGDWPTALRVAIPFILGDNIGTTITAEIAAIRTSVAARRTARGHTLFNVIGVLYMFPLVWAGWFADIVEWITPFGLRQNTIMVHIAVAHSAFNVFNTFVFLPLVEWLEAVVTRFVPARAGDAVAKPVVLEEHLLNTPEIAVDQARREIVRMANVARQAVNQAIEGLDQGDRRKLVSARQTEDAVDNFQYEITSYLAALSRRGLSEEVSIELPVLLHTVNDLERVGDHAVNIAEIAERKIEQKLVFSDSAQEEGARLKSETNEMFDRITAALENNDTEAARSALTNEENLNRMQIDFRRSHVQRMTEGVCSPQAGLIFIDLVDNIEKIGDHLTNIAQAVIGGLQWDGVEAKIHTGT
ncbi:MAG: Na/Pi cotransporter family protein [Planctomycetota bacterium]